MATYKVNGFTKWSSAISEDVVGGKIPDEITYKGFTTKNLHHSEDARRSFLATIDRAQSGKIHDDSNAILKALKATDLYMQINDVHIQQDKQPSENELEVWREAHQAARKYLNHVGEFMHHMDYWHNHEHELQDIMGGYNLETAGAEMADSYEPQGNKLHEAVTVKKQTYSWGKMVTVHHGASKSYPLHPEHQKAIKDLGDGEKTHFRDETGRTVQAHREGDMVHLSSRDTNKPTTVPYHHFAEQVEVAEENQYMWKIEGGSGKGKEFGVKSTTVDDHLSAMKYHSSEYQKAMKEKRDSDARHHGMKYHKHKDQIERLGSAGDYRKEEVEVAELDEDFTKMDTSSLKKWITTRQRNAMGGNLSKQRRDQYDQAQAEMKRRQANEEIELDEAGAFSYGVRPPRKGSVAYNAMMKRKEQEKGRKPIEPKDQMVGAAKVKVDEELTAKTIKSSDKIKVARVIADMLGVENAESMSPENAVNTGLRKMKTRRMTPELVGVVKKMLQLAQEVGIKVDTTLIPKAVSEEVVNKNSNYNLAKDILRYKDFMRLKKASEGQLPEEDEVNVVDPTEVGHSIHPSDDEDQLRRMKVAYKTESVDDIEEQSIDLDTKAQRERADKATKKAELILRHARERETLAARHHTQKERLSQEDMYSADYKVSKSGRKYRAHRIDFANSGTDGKPSEVREQVEFDLSDDELDQMANGISHEDHILDVYDDEELAIVDDSGEEVKDDVNEQALNEVLSRVERMRAKIRFLRSQPKRERRLQIVLKRRSDVKTINKRARRLATKMLKEKMAKKPLAQMTVSEKERVEKILAQRKGMIDRLAMKLVPRVRKIESERLSHSAQPPKQD